MSSLISLDEVGVCYASEVSLRSKLGAWAIKDLSFSINSGETVGIVGRNGAGKSTLLKLLAGIIDADKGTVSRMNGVRCTLLTLQLGFNGFLSGRENAIISGMLLGCSRAAMELRLDSIHRFSGLGEFFDQPLSTYSSGMRARLGFSVAIESNPDVVLIDEALGVGDHEFRRKSTEVMKEWIRSDKTVVLVSHDTGVIADLCDRAIWIENGLVAMTGGPEEVIERYHSYDRAVKALAAVYNGTEEQIRCSDFGLDPLQKLLDFELGVKQDRKVTENKFLKNAGQGVELFSPYNRPSVSQVFRQACGGIVWIEQGRQIMCGDDEVYSIAEEYRHVVLSMAEQLNVSEEDLRRSSVGKSLSRVLSCFSA